MVVSEVVRQPSLLHDQITEPATKPTLEDDCAGVAVQTPLAKAGTDRATSAAASKSDFTNHDSLLNELNNGPAGLDGTDNSSDREWECNWLGPRASR